MKIDSHQHFWRYTAEEFDWIDDRMQAIKRDFLPADLLPELESVGVDGVISVQARQSVDETRFLLQESAAHEFIVGVVGWVPLASRDVGSVLEELADDKHLVGVRHIIHDEPDDAFILRSDFNAGVDRLLALDLAYDILVFDRHLPQTLQFVDRHPEQRFVIDHIGKPRIMDRAIDAWRTYMESLSQRPNCNCKFSGLVTEANWRDWSEDDIRPYWEVVLETFGPSRLLFGSDWPVCLLATDYRKWYGTVARLIEPLSDSEKDRILGGTAAEVYRLTW